MGGDRDAPIKLRGMRPRAVSTRSEVVTHQIAGSEAYQTLVVALLAYTRYGSTVIHVRKWLATQPTLPGCNTPQRISYPGRR